MVILPSVQITRSDLFAAMAADPVLAASMGPSGCQGERQLETRISGALHWHRCRTHGVCNTSSGTNDASSTRQAKGASRDDQLTWAEFVAIFIPVGSVSSEVLGVEGRTAEADGHWRADLDEEELSILRVVFATADHALDGRVSVAELRALCIELDGEEPPEAPVQAALDASEVPGCCCLNLCHSPWKSPDDLFRPDALIWCATPPLEESLSTEWKAGLVSSLGCLRVH